MNASRKRNLFLLLCAGCVVAVAIFGYWSAQRPSTTVTEVNPIPEIGIPLQVIPVPQKAAPASSEVQRESKPAEVKSAPRKLVYFRRNGAAETPGKLGETLGRLSAAQIDGDNIQEDQITEADLTCARVYFRAGKGICVVKNSDASSPGPNGVGRALRAWLDSFSGYSAVLFDDHFHRAWSIPLNGLPSRVRVSPGGKLAAVTVFLSGQSYSSLRFSTQTLILNAADGKILADLEKFAVSRNGQPFQSPDFNFWGVTFARDENRFYATLWTKSKTYLVEGNLAARTANVIYEGVECPSLSPDGTRIGFKKRSEGVGIATTWRVTVLDLKTLTETPLAETRSVDDQVEWLDNHHLVYALPQNESAFANDIWMESDQPNTTPRLWLKGASSPAVVTAN